MSTKEKWAKPELVKAAKWLHDCGKEYIRGLKEIGFDLPNCPTCGNPKGAEAMLKEFFDSISSNTIIEMLCKHMGTSVPDPEEDEDE